MTFNRREAFLAAGATALGGILTSTASGQTESKPPAGKFRFGLNMSTIRGQDLDAAQEIEIAGKAGYTAIEPWLGKLHDYVSNKGTTSDLRKRIEDHGLTVESAIGFAPWVVNDDEQRAKGLEQAKVDMELIASLGGTRIAAPPAGVPRGETVSLDDAADRYRALLELGDKTGVTPQIEMWGGNPVIGKVSTALYIAIQCGHPKACFLGDVYHTYKGGCDFYGLKLLGPQALQTFHMNDYPADPPRETIRDEHRVYPGDGIAPLDDILQGFASVGAYPVLSLELFNREYWKQDALQVAKTGLAKMKDAVAKAFG